MLRALFVILNILISVAVKAQSRYDYFLHEAERQSMLGNVSASFDMFRHALNINPKSSVCLFNLALLYKDMSNDSVAIDYMQRAAAIDSTNYWYMSTLAQMLMGTDKKAETRSLMESMSERFPERSEVLMALVGFYQRQNDYESVLRTLNRLEVKEGKSEDITMQKYRIYLQMQDKDAALRELQSLADEYPNDLQYQVMIGNVYQDNGEPEKAIAIFDSVLEQEPNNASALFSRSMHYQRADNDSLFNLDVMRLVSLPDFDDRTRAALAVQVVNEVVSKGRDSLFSVPLLNCAIAATKTDEFRLGLLYEKIAYMLQHDYSADSIKAALHSSLEIDPEDDRARMGLLSYAVREENYDAVRQVCKTAVDYGSTTPDYYYYLAL